MVHEYEIILTYENFMKTFKTRQILNKENVSLSSLHLSGNWIKFTEFVEFVENHFLRKLHVRGRFRFPRRSLAGWRRGHSPSELSDRTDLDLIISKIIKNDVLKIF